MGSEQNARNGLRRRGDGATGFASQYTIVGLDIDADDLIKRYAGTKRAAWVEEVVRGAVQRQRTAQPPSAAFTRGLRRAKVIPPVVIVDLGRDGTKDGEEIDATTNRKRKAGKNHSLIIDGRQRTMSERENDKAREANGEPPRLLDCDYMVPSAKTPREDVILFRVGSAIREPRSILSRAEDAADMMAQRYAAEDVAPYVEAKDVAEVVLLVTLYNDCCEVVQQAVNANKIGLARVAEYAKHSHAEQARRAEREIAAPKGDRSKSAEAARNGAAPPRLKARTPGQRAAMVAYLDTAAAEDAAAAKAKREPVALFSALDVHALVRWMGGDDDAIRDAGVSDNARTLAAAAWPKPGGAS